MTDGTEKTSGTTEYDLRDLITEDPGWLPLAGVFCCLWAVLWGVVYGLSAPRKRGPTRLGRIRWTLVDVGVVYG